MSDLAQQIQIDAAAAAVIEVREEVEELFRLLDEARARQARAEKHLAALVSARPGLTIAAGRGWWLDDGHFRDAPLA
jgi:hypothetical protein